MQPHRDGILRPSPCGGRLSPAVVNFVGAEKGFMRSRWIISAAGSPLVEQFLRRKPRGAAQKRPRRFSLRFQFVPSLKFNLLHPLPIRAPSPQFLEHANIRLHFNRCLRMLNDIELNDATTLGPGIPRSNPQLHHPIGLPDDFD